MITNKIAGNVHLTTDRINIACKKIGGGTSNGRNY
jgi:hypothetical protein